MKHSALTILTLSVLFTAGFACGDYANPPMWEQSMDFTHQSWDFDEPEYTAPEGPALPLNPDGTPEPVNGFGDAALIETSFDVPPEYQHLIAMGLVGWMYEVEYLETPRKGYYGGMGHTHLKFHVPAAMAQAGYDNLIWVQMTYFGRMDGEEPFALAAAHDEEMTDSAGIETVSVDTEVLDETGGSTGRWYRTTGIFRYCDKNNGLYLKLSVFRYPPDAEHTMGGSAMVDQVDIDTKTVSDYDFNGDDVVDLADFAFLAGHWLSSTATE
jgi:hypothetical protein